jgi:phosphohistidine phosphatase
MGEVPDLVVSSTAVRAESTAELSRLAGGWACPLRLDDDLYGSGPDTVLEVAARHGDDAKRLMLVGHEPTWSMLITRLTGARAQVKTGTVAGIDLDIASWEDAPTAAGTLAFLVHPRMIIGGEDGGR